MKKLSSVLSLLAGLAVLGLALFGVFNLTRRPGIPREHLTRPIIGVDSHDIRRSTDLRFILSRKMIGDPVEIRFGPDGGPAVVRTVIVPYYSQTAFPLVFVLMGSVSLLAGFGVFLFKPREPRARIFYWLSLSFGAAVMIGGSSYGVQGRAVNVLPGVLFNFAYPMTVAVLLWFARSYAPPRRRIKPALFWAVPLAWGVFLCGAFLVSQRGPSIAAFRLRQQAIHVFRLYIVFMAVASLVELARAFRHAATEEDRTQIKWYFIGLLAGLGPFLVFYQLPLALTDRPLLSEDFASIFFFLLPIFMAMAILQFRLLRVNIVFHRGLVYALFTVFVLCAYLFSVEALRRVFPRATAAGNALISVGAALAVALALSPGRRKVQNFVDRLFFRQAYDYRQAIQEFQAGAPSVIDAGRLVALFSETLTAVLPVDRIGVLVREARGEAGDIRLLGGLDGASAGKLLGLPLDATRPWARPGKVRGVEGLDFTREDVLEAAGLAVVLTMPGGAGTPAGLLAFGPKTSGHRFTKEDIDLIETLSGDLAVNLGRIRIQEQVIYERASREKSEELVRLKTEFISSVSHELRTPMTSLRGLSELLRSGKVGDEARREKLLGLMAGECGRLTRFLTNVLDFGKIEGDVKVYDLRETALGPLVREVADLVREGQPDGDIRLAVEAPAGPVTVRADPDALRQALLNLVDNALKYSPDRKEVTVSLTADPDAITIAVRDRGMGIAAEDRDRIFEAFFRSPRAVETNPAGVGLGLKIVKHIMAAHGGRVAVESEPGKGSVFSLVFPLPRSSGGSG
jgi:signal transduction histidine kinase